MTKHIVVIGGGILGCLSALRLREQGHRVTLIEQGVIGNQTAGTASWAAAGILFPLLPWAYSDSVNLLAVEGMRGYAALCQQLFDETGIDPEYRQDGILLLPSIDAEKARAWSERYGFVIEKANVAGIAAVEGALWMPQIAQVRPPRLLKALRQWLVHHAVELREHTALVPLSEEASNHLAFVATAEGARIEADAFVLTGGAWTQQLLGVQAQGLQIKPMRGQMLLYPQPEAAPLQHMVFREGFYMVPRGDGCILAGSCVEDVGFDSATTESMATELATKAVSVMPALHSVSPLAQWSGLRPGSPNNMPTIARHPVIDNLYLNSGHFRYGLTMAPSSATILADLIAGNIQTSETGLNSTTYAYVH